MPSLQHGKTKYQSTKVVNAAVALCCEWKCVESEVKSEWVSQACSIVYSTGG